MTDLIRRLEEAKEGNDELDIAFWLRVVPGSTYKKTGYTHIASGKYCSIDETRDATGRLIIVPHYTTNLQDAVSAVPEGLDYTLQSRNCYATLADWSSGTSGVPKGTAMAKTLPLALCIAILRALEAKNE